jgi:ligand-binding SRPBCC domain-containing protein
LTRWSRASGRLTSRASSGSTEAVVASGRCVCDAFEPPTDVADARLALMARIVLATSIAAPIERVFDAARDIDLHMTSMAHTRERAIAGRTSGLIQFGETVTWRARHLGLWWSLTSRITAMDPPTQFVDEQASGPFASFRHEHRFEAIAEGTRMTDDWTHVPPLGWLGRIADRLFLKRMLLELLRQRAVAIRMAAERAD